MTQRFNQCRFCGKAEFDSGADDLVKYGVRHYAHFKCYLDAGKKLSALHAWQVNKFPYFLLKERDLLGEALAITKRDEERTRRMRS